jgi:transcriptional regulator of acetoin/glycerol metabolism
VLSRGDKLTLRDVPAEIREDRGHTAVTTGPLKGATSMMDAERNMIVKALEDNKGNRTRAAEQLGISRRTLHRKLNEFDLRD